MFNHRLQGQSEHACEGGTHTQIELHSCRDSVRLSLVEVDGILRSVDYMSDGQSD